MAWSLKPIGIGLWDSVLPVLVGSIPAIALSVSWNLKKTKTSNTEEEQKTLTNLSYEYGANEMQNDLESVLSILSEHKYNVIFVIDNLDQVSEDFMVSLTGLRKLLSYTPLVYFVFIGDDSYYRYMLEKREKRSKESNLFTQNIFLPRPSFEEMKKYIDMILEVPNLESLNENKQYVKFKDYACYASKTDFFHLYPLLRDRIVGYDQDGHPQLGIQLDRNQSLQAQLQGFLEGVYQKSVQPNNWYFNELFLEQMYKLLEMFREYEVGTRFKLNQGPKYNIIFLGDNASLEINNRIEATALMNLIGALKNLRFINSTSEKEYEYEIKEAFDSICINCGSKLHAESICKQCNTYY